MASDLFLTHIMRSGFEDSLSRVAKVSIEYKRGDKNLKIEEKKAKKNIQKKKPQPKVRCYFFFVRDIKLIILITRQLYFFF